MFRILRHIIILTFILHILMSRKVKFQISNNFLVLYSFLRLDKQKCSEILDLHVFTSRIEKISDPPQVPSNLLALRLEERKVPNPHVFSSGLNEQKYHNSFRDYEPHYHNSFYTSQSRKCMTDITDFQDVSSHSCKSC
jgi:hypothetical protein